MPTKYSFVCMHGCLCLWVCECECECARSTSSIRVDHVCFHFNAVIFSTSLSPAQLFSVRFFPRSQFFRVASAFFAEQRWVAAAHGGGGGALMLWHIHFSC